MVILASSVSTAYEPLAGTTTEVGAQGCKATEGYATAVKHDLAGWGGRVDIVSGQNTKSYGGLYRRGRLFSFKYGVNSWLCRRCPVTTLDNSQPGIPSKVCQ